MVWFGSAEDTVVGEHAVGKTEAGGGRVLKLGGGVHRKKLISRKDVFGTEEFCLAVEENNYLPTKDLLYDGFK